ncbi:helix-turn-helix domain-containing protein [Streptomyces cyaneofuscatus]|uniref:helix-turn-helix domain-containing protein n=1 Tax=Streptomyces cyaneofuscatus TaxID=66883 RepID=UPI0036606FF2
MTLDTGMDFGPWLARQLKQSGMSQADLAQRIGLTRAAVSAWITGRATPREETINKIAEALGTDLGTIHTRTADTLAGLPISWYHRPGHADGGREFGNAAAFAFEADVEVLAREATQNSLDERLDLAQPVRVRYTLHELSGEALARFRDEIRWDDLLPHYEAAAEQDQKVGRMIAAGLSDMYDRDRLVLLRIDDYNASGLTGDDYETGRFAAVVRRQLDSQKSMSGAGGSYGLGKATLWATSRLGLVLMNSTLSEPHEGRTERRLVGRLDLPWRKVGDRTWAGPAWFGRPDPDAEDVNVARSWWADEESVERLHLTRESAEPGTSFLIVGAHDVASLVEETDEGNADVEDDDSVHRMHHRLKDALGRNFWAAMTGGGKQRPLLEASVRTFRNGVEIIPETRVDPRETQPSRTRALQAFLDGTTVDRLTEAGQVAMTTVPLMVPGRTGRGSGGEHRAVVLVTEADDRDHGKPNRVTTMRGNRMTVKIGWVPGLPVGTNLFQAVLLAGRAAGDDAPFADEAEAFLRAAEPPEHDKWGQTEELRMLYSPSAYRRIGALTYEANKAVRDLVALPKKSRKVGSERLRKRLTVGGRKATRPAPAAGPPTLEELDARIDDSGAWCVTAEMKIPAGGDSWRPTPVAKLDVRSGPRPVLAWSELVAVHNCEIVDGAVRFVPGSRTATFRGTTDVSTHPVRAQFSGLVVELRTDKGAQA